MMMTGMVTLQEILDDVDDYNPTPRIQISVRPSSFLTTSYIVIMMACKLLVMIIIGKMMMTGGGWLQTPVNPFLPPGGA